MLLRNFSRKKPNGVIYFLAFLFLLTQDVGSFGTRFLIVQYLILMLFLVLLMKNLIKEKSLVLPLGLLVLMGYITVITIVNTFDMDGLTDMLFFFVSLITVYWLIKDLGDIKIFYKLFYNVAVVMSIIALLQFVTYLLGIDTFYDLAQYGFSHRLYIRYNLLAPSALYAEPAHAAPLLTWATWVILIGKEKKLEFVKSYKSALILIFAVLSQSAVVYVSVFLVFCIYIFIYQKQFLKKVRYLALATCAVIALMLISPDFIISVLRRLNQFETVSTTTANDLSALAIVSNLRIAIEKMKDGYLFGTGFDSHRLYYDQYIRELYGTIIMDINKNDCATLYTRIFSEFGIIGFVVFAIASVKRFFTSINKKNMETAVFLILFMIVIMRNGDYINIITTMTFVFAFILPIKESSQQAALTSKESE